MAHRSLFSKSVVAKPSPTKKRTPSAKKPRSAAAVSERRSSAKWGTLEEKYRRLCMLCLLCRMTYYIHSKSIVNDETYDSLEWTIRDIENKHRELMHPKSPTCWPGSDQEDDYPVSARMLWSVHRDDPKTWEAVEGAIVVFIKEYRQEFGLEESKKS